MGKGGQNAESPASLRGRALLVEPEEGLQHGSPGGGIVEARLRTNPPGDDGIVSVVGARQASRHPGQCGACGRECQMKSETIFWRRWFRPRKALRPNRGAPTDSCRSTSVSGGNRGAPTPACRSTSVSGGNRGAPTGSCRSTSVGRALAPLTAPPPPRRVPNARNAVATDLINAHNRVGAGSHFDHRARRSPTNARFRRAVGTHTGIRVPQRPSRCGAGSYRSCRWR